MAEQAGLPFPSCLQRENFFLVHEDEPSYEAALRIAEEFRQSPLVCALPDEDAVWAQVFWEPDPCHRGVNITGIRR